MALKENIDFKATPLYLMDASAFIFKGYYGNMKMTRSDGFPVGAIYSVARVLFRILKEEQPQYFSFIKDGKGTNFRHELYPLYKANRQATPEELIAQFAPIEELVRALGLHFEASVNCEADDCIASLAMQNRQENHVVIVGIDKDLKQCLHPQVFMWDPSGKERKIVTLESFKESSGFDPSQWADIQAIIGDSSDNIPGIRGIGEKTAEKIFKDFPTLEAIRDNFEELPPKIKEKFADNIDAMFLYRELTKLNTECCAHIKKEDLKVREVDYNACMNFFRTYEMPTLQKELTLLKDKGLIKVATQSTNKEINKKTSSLLAGTQLSLFDILEEEVYSEPTCENIQMLPEAKGDTLALLPAYSIKRGTNGFYIAFADKEFLYTGDTEELLTFINSFKNFVCVDYKSLLHENTSWLSGLSAEVMDLSLLAYLLNPEQRDYSWNKISSQYRDRTKHISFAQPAKLALCLQQILIQELEKKKLSHLYKKIESPLVPILASMEKEGILLDTHAMNNFLAEVQNELEKTTEKIYSLAGTEFNIRSAQQTGDILYKRLELPTVGKTKGGQTSTSQDSLEKLMGKHPIVDAILEYRKLEKLRSTYLEPLPKLLGKDGKIHTCFNQMATATGRLSSSNPNLQNIPIRGEMGQRMRECFIAKKGECLISADYSQIELRVLAHYSQEPSLIEAFKNNEDIHKSTAALLNNVDISEVSLEQRQAAKTINFGLLYGMGARKLAQDIKVTMKEAQSFIERYFDRFKGIKSFYDTTLKDAKEKGYVVTIAGRLRALPDLSSQNHQAKALAERQAINTLIQGSAADIIKVAMLSVFNDAELKSYNVKLLLQVHDELILSVAEEYAQRAGARLAFLMSQAMKEQGFSVPLKVEYASAPNWLLAH